MHDYNTDYERAAEKVINYITGNKYTILNPRDVTPKTIKDVLSSFEETQNNSVIFFREMCNIFFPMIDESELVACVPYSMTGKYSSGVITEIEYAKRIGKNVIEIPHLNKYIIEKLGWSNEFTL